ncbi:unnamed protein product [Medioppia subpectinata]|uniref:Glycosyltransferase n=1 Tax=Medioppia subpectinata TaxID=1979941 RepID=A0A7R9KLY4_9ACAR|nr:unnamed protein product [Medioppia subpectinata]CAG2106023.1 unnamed protein product [Medioppia subpectinata]
MANKQLKMLFVPLLETGHVNACLSIAERVIAAGHRAVFTVNDVWSGRLTHYGIEEVGMTATALSSYRSLDKEESARQVLSSGRFSDESPLRKARQWALIARFFTKHAQYMDEQLRRLLPAIRPDVIVLDQFSFAVPAIELSGVTCVWCWSADPLLMVDDERAPPPESGLSATGDQSLWQEFRQLRRDVTSDGWKAFNSWVVGRGCEPLPDHCFHNPRRYLNLYGIPQELDYQVIRPLGRNYVRFDNLMRRPERHLTFAVPPALAAKPGALVYFSLGSMCAIDVQNMRRLVAILAKSRHRFIVSMGPMHTEYTLADNMWGAEFVPQLQMLPLVDAVLTHGGPNTVNECLYFGRPMIVLPVCGDQYDYAQRLQDKGFGLRLDAHRCEEGELLSAIETVLNDRPMADRLAEVSQRIQTDNSLAKVPQIIEDFVQNPRKYID